MFFKDEKSGDLVPVAEKTSGDFGTEEEAKAYLDAELLTIKDLFKAFTEVPGRRLLIRPGQEKIDMRIDRILIPTAKASAMPGCPEGALGIEIKRSGYEAGKMIAQAQDYRESLFKLPGSGVKIHLDYVLCFPSFDTKGIGMSQMAQWRLGLIDSHPERLVFKYNNCTMFWQTSADKRGFGIAQGLKAGLKAGSR
jgi:hypothetical protein